MTEIFWFDEKLLRIKRSPRFEIMDPNVSYSLIKPPKDSIISGGEILSVLLKLEDVTDAESRWEQWTDQIDTIVDKGVRCDNLIDCYVR